MNSPIDLLKVARSRVFSRSTNLESKPIDFFVWLKLYQTVSFGSLPPFTVRKIGDFPHFLSALPSNNQFITPHMVVGTLKISLDRLKKKKERSLVECCSVSCCE